MPEFLIFALFRTSIARGIHSHWAVWWAHGLDHAVHHATYFIVMSFASSFTSCARGLMSLRAWWWASIFFSDHATDVAHRLIGSGIYALALTGRACGIKSLGAAWWSAWPFGSVTWWSSWSTLWWSTWSSSWSRHGCLRFGSSKHSRSISSQDDCNNNN